MVEILIVEGMDGTGKSRLVAKLSEKLSLPIHSRFATSLGGPPPDLMNLVYQDAVTMDDQPFSIYDRHGAISEFVYGPIVRGKLPIGFDSTTMHKVIRMIAARSLVIWCRPPYTVVDENVSGHNAAGQMYGVTAHSDQLYHSYEGFRQYWPGDSISYDYTMGDAALGNLLVRVATYMNSTAIQYPHRVKLNGVWDD